MDEQVTPIRIINLFILGLFLAVLPRFNTFEFPATNLIESYQPISGEVLSKEFLLVTLTPTNEILELKEIQSPTPTTENPNPTKQIKLTNPSNTPIPPTNSPIPTATKIPSSCPVSTQSCIPCNAGESYCRYLPGETTSYLGWACQNNNPGNIRPASFKNTIIENNGGTAPCGDKGGYMVFKTYNDGFNGLKSYLKGISYGQHSSYTECIPNGSCTLIEFFSHYAPAGDQNDPNSYANKVATRIGVDANSTTLRWIVDNKLTEMANAIQIQEGWFSY